MHSSGIHRPRWLPAYHLSLREREGPSEAGRVRVSTPTDLPPHSPKPKGAGPSFSPWEKGFAAAPPLLACLLTASLLLTACGQPPPSPPAAEIAPAAGRLRLEQQTIADLKPVPATLTTRDMADARARIGGVLVRLLVRAGDHVSQGQLIASVRDDRIGLQTGAYDAQVAAAAAQVDAARAEQARTQDLFSHGVYAQARLDQVEAQAKAANGALASARAQRAASAEQGAQGAIYAPASGRVLVADVPAGSVVMAGESIAKIAAGPSVVRIELPEGEAQAIKLGQTVRLASGDLGSAVSGGTITQIYPAVNDGAVVADVTAANLPGELIGRHVRAVISVGERQALVIPRRYVQTRFGVDSVRLVARDGTVSETPVQVRDGPTADQVEILSGVRAGDVLTPPVAQ